MLAAKLQGTTTCPKAKDVVNEMRVDRGLKMSYWQAWKARENAVEMVRGCPKNSYKLLPSYLVLIKEANPGTVTEYLVDDDGSFKYAFLALGPCLTEFSVMRKVIVVDCTFLTGKFKGALLSAICQDGNEQIYPLPFGIANGENDRSWEWFFCQLGSFIPDTADTVFISDRHASISRAIRKVYPSAKHGVCTYHLSKNLMTKFKCKRVTPLFKEAALAFTRSHFDRVFDHLRKIDEGVAKYLEEIDVRMWSRAYFEGCRYNIMTSNIVESWNSVLKGAKDYPIVPLFEHIRQTLTQASSTLRHLPSVGTSSDVLLPINND
ncbi:PREDICTED: uncharacterized protein LOC104801724 [Tarenaya hassleriana]|uniref:uncharacterized protein LOC104801724 n=1 Tax=Tarenaya hassleriana TaxID=28532 RepID=UPI00053C8403|nr:PREDICTED: uncharacterized protein LOC104801724 [Tarenaya hassleriana]